MSLREDILNRNLKDEDILDLLYTEDPEIIELLRSVAEEVTLENYSDKIYIRGLVEISNYCREGCLYCGIGRGNKNLERYHLSPEEVISSAKLGYSIGFRTFVLQGGEDPALTDDYFLRVIGGIKDLFPETRITLSLGKKSKKTLKAFKEAGADRYLLRHETANPYLFARLHPKDQDLEGRVRVLYDLKELGYTVGSGFLIGAPFQKLEDFLYDFHFLDELQPDMIGVGPFIPQKDTIFSAFPQGDLLLTLKILSILRIKFPKALIPSTTALNSIDKEGRILGIRHGANVIMPNLSPKYARDNYKLYDHKAKTNLESYEGLSELNRTMNTINRRIVIDVGDPLGGNNEI